MSSKRINYRFGYILQLKNRRSYFITVAKDDLGYGTSLVQDDICKVGTDNPMHWVLQGFVLA